MKNSTSMKSSILGGVLAAVTALGYVGAAQAQQGVTSTEIIVGSHTALSGPAAGWGVPVTNGLRMRAEEINARGGIHGRKIRLIVEDTAYSPTKAAQAGAKLINRDKIFVMLAGLGTTNNMVVLPMLKKKNLHNLFPLSAAPQMHMPLSPLKFSIFPTHYDGMRASVKYFIVTKGKKRVGILYQDDDYGKDVLSGVEAQLKAHGLKLVAKTTYKRGAKDFSSQIQKLRAAKADLVVLGTVIRETIGSVVTARKLGWNVDMLVSASGYTTYVATLAKGATDGLYGSFQTPIFYADTATGKMKAWIERYKAKFGANANLQSVWGYRIMSLFAVAAQDAGKSLNNASLTAALERIKGFKDTFGGPPLGFSKTQHVATRRTSLAQIQKQRWVTMVENLTY